jgi:hypothetical protein
MGSIDTTDALEESIENMNELASSPDSAHPLRIDLGDAFDPDTRPPGTSRRRALTRVNLFSFNGLRRVAGHSLSAAIVEKLSQAPP